MDKKRYSDLVNKHMPKENKIYNVMKAFIVGGGIGVLGQFLIDIYVHTLDIPKNEANSYMIITLIFIAALFTAIGFFDNFVAWAKAGLIIPITGFAHAMSSAAIEYRKEGLIMGIGSNIFKIAGSVILYGVVSAYVFGIIRFVIFGG
ncbi:MAG: SpoVA/SpoVAEb family sporulation membrane protein [Bacilli bacterium]|nr:SpoVA/SpoVAEb family sporulation membrane protein [Bacilli bacterium]MDD4298741.1 SpoVA/SpoVAEb family sporulation membrane protein [Bacilli bacterium]MDD4643770.1 SpoVA/SpoVAEb family sporulation membrane protein [Bacilli bacterium]